MELKNYIEEQIKFYERLLQKRKEALEGLSPDEPSYHTVTGFIVSYELVIECFERDLKGITN